MMNYFSDTSKNKFYTKVVIGKDCWEWTGAKTRCGYGLFYVQSIRKMKPAHRYAKEMETGVLMPDDMDASHLCHNRICVNPTHIIAETHEENIARSKGRSRSGCSRARFSIDDIHRIRNPAHSTSSMAGEFNVNPNTIRQIKRRLTYKDIPEIAYPAVVREVYDAVTPRLCLKCEIRKPANQFDIRAGGSKLRSWCKQCSSLHASERKIELKKRASIISPEEKICFRCRKILPANAFYRSRVMLDGLQPQCKECGSNYQKARRASKCL